MPCLSLRAGITTETNGRWSGLVTEFSYAWRYRRCRFGFSPGPSPLAGVHKADLGQVSGRLHERQESLAQKVLAPDVSHGQDQPFPAFEWTEGDRLHAVIDHRNTLRIRAGVADGLALGRVRVRDQP